VIVEADGLVPSGVSEPKGSLRNLGWLFLPAARGGELRVAAVRTCAKSWPMRGGIGW
jgi:hypothetical protein